MTKMETKMKQLKQIAAIAGFVLSSASMATIPGSAEAQTTFADTAVVKIMGHWEANDNRNNGRVLKFFIRDGNPSFEDSIEAGISLTGTYRQDQNGAAYVFNYANGRYQCSYNISARGFKDRGDAVLTMHLVRERKPHEDPRFHCFSGRLEQVKVERNF